MATRSLLNFENGITIYKHWDGYPSGTLRELRDCLNNGVRTTDTDYYIGGIMQQFGIQHQKQKDRTAKELGDDFPKEMKNAVLGFGIFPTVENIDCWQEYQYDLREKTITIYNGDKTLQKRITIKRLLKMTDKDLIKYEKELFKEWGYED